MDDFLKLAMRGYDASITDIDEFKDDLELFNMMNKMLTRYENTKKPNSRLILNYLIIIQNIFTISSVQMLFLKTSEDRWSILATFLKFLNLLPEQVIINGKYYTPDEFLIDDDIIRELESL